ncbi:disease resistance protein RPS4B-like [Ziziphus jujuba]|uniref:Disease resistance protein RPS4B-like n=1 Tax=Ziziphus jujuba TaxID=326968 RepID=A0ABM4AB41_ZIZJJ|nr:disease resistance protein RPS4B-like [Ziziphus jujuba]
MSMCLGKQTNRIHKVKRLNGIESLDLFRLHAFPENPVTTDDGMVLEVIRYAHGNPPVLKVLGCFLCRRDKTVWQSALKKLKRDQNLEIQQVLKISYDRLDNGSKDMFLDIAFLYNSSFTRDHAKSILGDAVEMEITLLIEKCLIEHDEGNELRMHDLLPQMGQEIVRDEDKEPGNRSRLCDAMEVCNVLENCTGTTAVEVISLNMFEVEKNVIVHPGAFSNMRNLRLLSVYNGHDYTGRYMLIQKFKLSIPQALHFYLPTKLRFLQWDSYPSKSLPPKFIPENLVGLLLRGSHVEKLWNSHKVVAVQAWFSFVHPFKNLDELTYVNLNGCSKLRYVEGMFKRPEELSESWIQKFKSNVWPYPSQAHISQKFAPNLRCLLLRETAIETVPPSIVYLSGLVELDLGFCKRLKSLPTRICHLNSLEELDLGGCEKLKTLPEILDPMGRFKRLYLSESGIRELPESIENLIEIFARDSIQFLRFLPTISSRRLSVCKRGCKSWSDYFTFYGCGKLDQNTRKMLADQALFHILSRLNGFSAGGCRSDYFCYPGDEIPEWFDHQTCGNSISNIVSPPNWNDPEFLSFAFCIVLHQNKLDLRSYFVIKWIFNSQRFRFGYEFPCLCADKFKDREVSSDHMIMAHVTKWVFQHEYELNLPDVSFHASLYLKDSSGIKKFGVRFIYRQDLERLYEKAERKNKTRFNECCESSGSEAVDSLGEEDDYKRHFRIYKNTGGLIR